MPAHQPASGLASTTGRSAGCSRSASPPMPCCRVVSPYSTSPNPASAAPPPDVRPRPRSLVNAQTKIIGSAAAVSETRTPISATSQPVPVVPTFAPKTSPSPCGNVSRPALTRPIVVMVVALDDCTSSVTMAPQNEPRSGVAAALPSTVRKAEPASPFRPPVMTVMPSRKRPTPPRTEIAVDILAQPRPLLLALELGARGGQRFLLRRVDRRVGKVELLHRFHDRGGDKEPGEPLVVGRHHVPRRLLRCRGPDRFLERVHVVVPEPALVHIGSREFPVLFRLVEPIHEPLFLFLPRNVQEELEDDHALPGEVVLEMRDVGEPFVPDVLAHEFRRQLLPLQDLLVHAHDQDLLVIRAVEDPDPSPLGHAPHVAPHQVLIATLPRAL